MTRGLTRDQIGVTEALQAAWADTVFRLSHNHQVRRGDPIRLKQFDEVERQRAALGLTDTEIAARIGLTPDQVLYIRTAEERRRFRTGHYHRLLELGGGRRFRAERFTPHLDHFRFGDDALQLRAAMRFDPARARRYVEQGWWGSDTLTGWLDRHAAERPDAPALSTGTQTLSYAELHVRVERLAAGLERLGIAKGDVVSVQLPNTPDYVAAYLAIARLGAVMSTIYMPYRAAELETLMRHARARAFIGLVRAGDFAPAATAAGLKAKLPALRHVLAVDGPAEGATAMPDLLADAPAHPGSEPPVAADPLLLLYTSGTTASPKAVPHNSHTLLSNVKLSVPEHGIGPDDVILSAAPFGHLFGLYSLQLALCAGACALLLPAFAPPALAALLEAGRPTALFAAPAHIAACLGAGLFDGRDLSSLKLAILSGSAVPGAVARGLAARAANCAVGQLWGMTETQAGLYTRPDDPPEMAEASAGRPSPGTEVRIADPDGNALPDGEEGELQVRGCLLFPGYFDNAEANQAAFTADGWFRSGDLAVRRPDGAVAITGRVKDVINRGGVKYNPRDVEDLIDAHPAVQQSAIVPVPDPVLGERACCFAVLQPGADLTLDALCAWLLEHAIAKHKLPERLQIVTEMPLTPTRKVVKGRLRLPEA